MNKALAVCFLALLFVPVRVVAMPLDKEPDPLFTMESRLAGQDLMPGEAYSIAFGTRYLLQNSTFSGELQFDRLSEKEFEVAGTALPDIAGEIVRWSSRRVFLLLYQDSELVARIYLPTNENAQHGLNFRKRFLLDKPFNRFEVTVIGAVRLK